MPRPEVPDIALEHAVGRVHLVDAPIVGQAGVEVRGVPDIRGLAALELGRGVGGRCDGGAVCSEVHIVRNGNLRWRPTQRGIARAGRTGNGVVIVGENMFVAIARNSPDRVEAGGGATVDLEAVEDDVIERVAVVGLEVDHHRLAGNGVDGEKGEPAEIVVVHLQRRGDRGHQRAVGDDVTLAHRAVGLVGIPDVVVVGGDRVLPGAKIGDGQADGPVGMRPVNWNAVILVVHPHAIERQPPADAGIGDWCLRRPCSANWQRDRSWNRHLWERSGRSCR